MINRYGWICPQCGRVWAPTITKCSTCELVATGGHGIKRDWPPVEDNDEEEYCTCYQDGECWGTREREKVDCKGRPDKCEKYNSDWR